MERAGGARTRDGRRAAVADADRPADQRRFSLRGLDTRGQHHDTGTGLGAGLTSGIGIGCGCATTAATCDRFRTVRSQEAAATHGCAGSARARATNDVDTISRARSLKRLTCAQSR